MPTCQAAACPIVPQCLPQQSPVHVLYIVPSQGDLGAIICLNAHSLDSRQRQHGRSDDTENYEN